MSWNEIRAVYPSEWLIIEALEAQTMPDHQRILSKMAVIERCPDGATAFQAYRRLHRHYPEREFYFVHTSREELKILERQWIGIRPSHATFYLATIHTNEMLSLHSKI